MTRLTVVQIDPTGSSGATEGVDGAFGHTPRHEARLKVGVVGTGRAGAVLGAALARAGHEVVAAYGVSELSRMRAEALLPGVPIVAPDEVLQASDLALITVPDDVLADVVRGLAETGAVRPGQFLVHASGRYGIGVLEPAVQAGALPMALHPAMTITGTSLDLERLVGAPFGVTTTDELRPAAEALVVEMGGEPVWIPEGSRALYHAALANGANHLVTLVSQSADLLTAAGVADPERLLTPLLTAALDNALRSGDQALTGPVVRGDAGSVAEHVRQIDQVSAEARRAYVAMARLTADRALASGRLSPEAGAALLEALREPDEDGA